MFSKLKEKLKKWTKGLSKSVEEAEEIKEIDVSEKPKEKKPTGRTLVNTQRGINAVTSRKEKKPSKTKKESKAEKKSKKKSVENVVEEIPEIEEPKIEKTETITELIEEDKQLKDVGSEKEIKEITSEEFEKLSEEELDKKIKEELEKQEYSELKKEFNAGAQKYEPDLRKLKKEILKGQDLDKTLKGEIPIDRLKDFQKQEKEPSEITTPEQIPRHEVSAISQGRESGEAKEPKEKKSFFSKFTSKINKITFTEKEFWEYAEELEMVLLENNVAFEVAEKIIEKLKERLVGKEFLKKELEGLVQDSLKEIIYEILIEPFDLIEKIKEFKNKNLERKPYVILFCGINGTGKTTTIAKIVNLLQRNKLTSVLAAGDTFRAASIEQLKKHGEKLNVNVISHEYGSDPASVGFDAIKYAEKNKIDVVLIDTAGRMHTEKNLMAQIEKVAKVTQPQTKIFVGESITGNDIVEQVKAFDDAVKIDGIILSKADIDEKGGTALSVGATTGKPILYLGTGQNYEDLEKFDKNKFVEKLGLGD